MTATGIVNRTVLSILVSLSFFLGAADSLGAADWRILYNSGIEKLGRRALAEARRDLKGALDAAEAGDVTGVQLAEILHALGWAESQMGRLRPAISYHERALALLPPADRTADLLNVAQAYRELGDARKAERYALEALGSSPGDPRILMLLASVLIQQRKYAEAENVAHRALSKGDPAIGAMIWADLGVVEHERGRFAPAAEKFQRAIDGMAASHPRARALLNLSLVEQRLKRYQEALLHARQAVAEMETYAGPQHPDLCKALERYAGALRHSGHTAEAQQAAERARQLQFQLDATIDWRSSNR